VVHAATGRTHHLGGYGRKLFDVHRLDTRGDVASSHGTFDHDDAHDPSSTPSSAFQPNEPTPAVARVTTADNQEVGMGDLRGTEFSRRQAGTDVLFFERRFTNKIDATMLRRPERPIAAKTRRRP